MNIYIKMSAESLNRIPEYSREQLLIMERFTEIYNAEPLDTYISMFDFSTLGKQQRFFANPAAADQAMAEAAEFDPNEICIVVQLREKLPPGYEIPSEFEGMKVITKL